MNFKNALSLLLLLIFLPKDFVRSEDQPLRVGIAMPFSGPASWMGESSKRGIELYLEEHLDFQKKVELVYEDITTANIQQGLAAVNKLLQQDKVHALVMQISPVCKAAGPAIDRAQVPTLAIAGDEVGRGRTYMTKFWNPVENEAKVIQEYLEQNSIRRVGIVSQEQDSMLARSQAVREAIKDRGIEIVIDVEAADSVGLQDAALKVSRMKPEAVIFNTMPGNSGTFAKRLREFRYGGKLIGSVVIGDANEQKLADGALAGAVFPDSALDPSFITKVQSKFGSYPTGGMANGYDAMKIFHAAISTSDQLPTGDRLNSLIRVKDFNGALGIYSFVLDPRNTYSLPARLRTVSGLNHP